MEKDKIIFVKQMLNSLEREIKNLENAKKENDPRAFNDIKKKCFDIQKQIEDLVK